MGQGDKGIPILAEISEAIAPLEQVESTLELIPGGCMLCDAACTV
jgi:hypothetical protein